MSTRTDFQGFMRGDEDNLTLRMSDFFTKCGGKAAVVNVRFTALGGTAPEKMNADPIIAEHPEKGGVDNVIEQIERVIVEKLGPNPGGTLRVQGYAKGEAGRNILDFSRTLVPSDLSGLGDPNLTLVRGLLDLKTRENAQLVNALVSSHTANAQLVGMQAQAIAQLATIRTAATSASDMQGITTILALGLIVVFAPHIKAALGVRPDASLEESITAIRRALLATNAPSELAGALANPPAPPLRALEGPAASAEGAEAGAEGAAGAAADEVRAMLDRLQADPAMRDRMLAEAMKIPTLADAAANAYKKSIGLA